MKKLYFGDVKSNSDVSLELGRLHAMCDIVCNYAENETLPAEEKESNLYFGLQAIHDLVAALEAEIDKMPVVKK